MAEIVTLPGISTPFAAGLSWRHEDTRPRPKALRALSLEKGRWGLVRETSAGTIQAGFCKPINGVTSAARIRSLAALVADQHPQPWMGRYRLSENRYWYVAVRDGQEVIPDGDRIGTAAEIERIRDEHLGLGEWTSDLEGTIDDLAEMARTRTRKLALSDLQRQLWIPVTMVSAALLVIAAASAGVVIHNDRVEAARKKADEENRRALAAAQRAQRVARSRVFPWTQQPMPSEVFRACGWAWRDQQLAADGWMLGSWRCEVNVSGVLITTEWDRAGGLAARAPGTLEDGGQKSNDSTQLPHVFAEPSSLVAAAQPALRAIWSFAQLNGLALTMAPVAVKPVLPGLTQDEPAADPWTTSQPVFTLIAPPWQSSLQGFDSVPGLRVRNIYWSENSQQWKVDATLYALRADAVPVNHPGATDPAKPLSGGHA
ncbi:type 4b pilus protein PilO2 [Paraburkholderia sp. BCC1885]|uniref:type 4b pilus protein PilO2 n=1 Tax=Paraburkholderia sp. BCC1885 TaxID=2562669 RepID=UPI00118237E1|nr:type 4b pilus protein PilO2 [Paraburkholderia sp. BCC1885]